MGIPTSQNPDTPEGPESRLSVRICKISAELLHSTESELENLRWTWMDSGRASVLKLLLGLREAKKSSGPQNPPSLSTLQRLNLEAPWGG
jgi:hypothetical protein